MPKRNISKNNKNNEKKQKIVSCVDTNLGIPINPKINKLNRIFYNVSCHNLSNSLLGMVLVRKLENGLILKGRIVETECYAGGDDKGSISYMGRRTPKIEPLYMDPGTTFVYMTYGMYFCINISSIEPGGGVLLRALQPIEGFEQMLKHRSAKRKQTSKPLKTIELCNGPSKLCSAMGIDKKTCDVVDLCNSEEFWIEQDNDSLNDKKVISCSRIGIDKIGQPWAGKHLRFYVLGNENVSKIDTKREEELNI